MNKNFQDEKNNVYLIKTMTGEEIFGYITNISKDTISIENPLVSQTKVMADGCQGVMISRFLPYINEPMIDFNNNYIAFTVKVSDEMAEYYKLSLEYAKTIDSTMNMNIMMASRYLKKVLSNDINELKKEIVEDVAQNILENFIPKVKN